jgi:hypothetical protein
MPRIATALTLMLLATIPASADAPPGHYDVTPLNKADVDLYLSVMRPAAAYVQNPSAEDRAAIAYMKQNHGNPKVPDPPKVPHYDHAPTPAEMAVLQKATDDYQKQIAKPQEYMARVSTLAAYDDVIAKQHHVEKQYDAVKDPIESALAAMIGEGGSCGGNDCGPPNPTAAQLALWKKEEDVAKASATFLKPYAPEIVRLRKILHDTMFSG